MKKICIRVDGNEIIATGHVMRCLSIAVQLRKIGADVVFVLADARPASMIECAEFEYHVLNSEWDYMDSEIDTFCQYIEDSDINTVLVDSYYVTEDYLKRLSLVANVCYIDDLDKFIYPVHTLVNYSLQYDRGYENRYYKAGYNTRFLLGGKYVPLREEFSHKPYKVSKKVQKILITTGGTDQLNMAYKLLEKFLKEPTLKTLEYNVIVGRFNKNRDMLVDLSKEYTNIIIHENVTNMSHWMRLCDVAVSAAGTTTFELSACGIPSICFEVADNQAGADMWEKGGYMLYAGNAYLKQEDCLNNCVDNLNSLCEDYELRFKMSRNMQGVVDGLGALRLADYLIKLSEEN